MTEPKLFMWDLGGIERVIAESPEDASRVIEETHQNHSCEHCRREVQMTTPVGSWKKVPEDEYVVLHTVHGGGQGPVSEWIKHFGRSHFCLIREGHAVDLNLSFTIDNPSRPTFGTPWEDMLHPDLVRAEKILRDSSVN